MAGPKGKFSNLRSPDAWKMLFLSFLLCIKYKILGASSLGRIKECDAKVAAQKVLYIRPHSLIHTYCSRAHHGWAPIKFSNLRSPNAWKMLLYSCLLYINYKILGAI